MGGLLRPALCGTAGLHVHPVRCIPVLLRVQLCQPVQQGGGQAHVGHGGQGHGGAAQGPAQLRLGEGNLEPHAVAVGGEVLAPAAGAVGGVGGQQQHPGVPGPGHGLHRLFSHRQAAAPQAEAQQG